MLAGVLRRASAVPRAAAPLARCLASSAGRFPLQPHSKQRVRAKKTRYTRPWVTLNDPRLTAKFLRYADRVARELGVTDEAAAFDEAAKAFPNPPPLVAATLLERSNVIMRDVEQWEADWLMHCLERSQAEAKHYPQQLTDLWTASDKVMEGSGSKDGEGKEDKAGKGGKADAKKGGKAKAEGVEGAAAAGSSAEAPSPEGGEEGAAAAGSAAAVAGGGGDSALPAAPTSLSDFYERSVGAGSSNDTEVRGVILTPRESSADAIGDKRSLDRAYTQRLVLLLRDKATGQWGFPRGERLEGEPMVQAAERALRAAFADPSLDVWYPGRAPVGHWLRVYSPEEQAARGCYGEKVFFYRAEVIAGRFRLPKTGPAAAVDPRDPASFPYDDFQWLTRDEAEGSLERPLWKYVHQVVGAGAGEEYARATSWKAKLAAKGISVAQGTGRRALRVQTEGRAGRRLPLVATRAQAELVAKPFSEAGKAEALAAAVDAHFDRVRASKRVSAVIRKEMNQPPMRLVVQKQLEEARARRAQAAMA